MPNWESGKEINLQAICGFESSSSKAQKHVFKPVSRSIEGNGIAHVFGIMHVLKCIAGLGPLISNSLESALML